ncbi:nucleotide-diphospho-sugar transferase [Synechococcus sp. TAK9802]|uniref:nucleotide-diphospho-sugar transferase n=1 Tax=Synechococcus sp. TAK9802 TaxID=1442558 RepID=UPI001648B569|nr:nucleotide-diphospho-sugar transferase [Synechococcus sp. TAK9802]
MVDALRKVKPRKIYIASDGAKSNTKDIELVSKARQITELIDWDCELFTLYRPHNLGCKDAVSSAISWFFNCESSGIILEDDTIPAPDFFAYCQYMLEKYIDDKSIWMICGFNPKNPTAITNQAFLSQNPSVWGWATWADRWKEFDLELRDWPTKPIKFNSLVPKYVKRFYKRIFNLVKNNTINCWGYQVTYMILKNNGHVVKPYTNLIGNIGTVGAHSTSKDLNHFTPTGQYTVPSKNIDIKSDYSQDLWFYDVNLKRYRTINRLINKIKKYLTFRT